MLKWEEQMEVKFIAEQGHSIRRTAAITGHARNTVRSILRGRRAEKPMNETRGRKSKIGDYAVYLEERYLKTGLSGTRLCEEIRQMGFTGSVSAVRRFLQKIERPGIAPTATVRYETPPGEQAQVDWAEIGYYADENGERRKIYAFVMVLGYSRMMYVDYVTDISAETLIACHQRAFAYFGGYTRRILYDNMKQVRLSREEWNPLFRDFLDHYGIAGATHRPYRARTKGKVERAVHYLRDGFLKGREFASLADLRGQYLVWQEETANARVHATTKEKPCERFARERLIPLTGVAEYRVVGRTTRKVSAEGYVGYNGSRYSVDPQAVGKTVLVEHSEQTIRVRAGDLVIAEHSVSRKKNAEVVDPKHRAEMWKLSVGGKAVPSSAKLRMLFDSNVDTASLMRYEEVIG